MNLRLKRAIIIWAMISNHRVYYLEVTTITGKKSKRMLIQGFMKWQGVSLDSDTVINVNR